MNNLIKTKPILSSSNNPNAVRSNKMVAGAYSKEGRRETSKHFLLGLMGVVFFCGAVGLVMPQGAEAKKCKAPGAWDQKITKNRFVPAFGAKNGNADAYCDRETGLVWARESTFFVGAGNTWPDAIRLCTLVGRSGRLGWHLPTKEQLASLVVGNNTHPALPSNNPFKINDDGFYWTATTRADDPTKAWVVAFTTGFLTTQSKSQPHYFWCVRGGESYDGN